MIKKHCFELQTEFHTKQINCFDEFIWYFLLKKTLAEIITQFVVSVYRQVLIHTLVLGFWWIFFFHKIYGFAQWFSVGLYFFLFNSYSTHLLWHLPVFDCLFLFLLTKRFTTVFISFNCFCVLGLEVDMYFSSRIFIIFRTVCCCFPYSFCVAYKNKNNKYQIYIKSKRPVVRAKYTLLFLFLSLLLSLFFSILSVRFGLFFFYFYRHELGLKLIDMFSVLACQCIYRPGWLDMDVAYKIASNI